MAKKNSIIRKLPAVETLGSASVICSDKTGTLTQNKMKVVSVKSGNDKLALKFASMCTDCNLSFDNGNVLLNGDPTETAIVNKALEYGQNKNEIYRLEKRIGDIPFDSKRKLMSTVHNVNGLYRVITKGAPDVLINRCSKIYIDGKIEDLTEDKKQIILKDNEDMAKRALRVIGVSYLDLNYVPNIDEKLENNLVFVGLIGMIDPPREGVKEAVLRCKNAGIKTVMITGDHIDTAKAIAKDLGILKLKDLAITGEELDRISQEELEKNIESYSVFARVSPEHKVRIVKAFQKRGNVVAMTGDGVNDAPALKNADIGVAMGKGGTDVAKNAADMILADDNFVTIVEAVKNGRSIYENIKKAIHFLISTNVGEIVCMLLGIILGLDTPLLAIQLLWINLVTDSFPGIALGLEPEEKDIMNKKPNDPKKGIFADGLWNKIFVEGTMIGVLTLFAFSLGTKLYGIEIGRTFAFVSLSFLELVHSFNIKSEKSIFKVGLFNNMYLVGAVLLGILLQTIVVVVPSLAKIFDVIPLNSTQWLYVILISVSPIFIMEGQKKINEIKNGKVVYRVIN